MQAHKSMIDLTMDTPFLKIEKSSFEKQTKFRRINSTSQFEKRNLLFNMPQFKERTNFN